MLVIREWAQSDPAAALGAALTIQDAQQRDQIISSAISTWASSDFPAAIDYTIKIADAGTRGRILQNLATAENADRAQMFEVLMEHAPAGSSFQQAMASLLNPWARENPRAAAAAPMQLPQVRSFSHIAGRVVDEWVSSGADKMEIFSWARSLPEGQGRSQTVNALFGAWAKEDPAGALRALTSLESGEKAEALQGIANGWSRKSPADTAAWAASLPSGPERDSVVRTAVNAWVLSSPTEASAFVGRLPEEERAGIMGVMVQSWATRDTTSAAAWLQRQPAGKSKDEGLKVMARQIALEDHEAALAWANSISNIETRAAQTESLAREWLRLDPANAKKWINKASLPADLRQRLLQ